MDKRILIISNSADIHADIVAGRIRDRGAAVFRLDLDHFPGDFTLDLKFEQDRWDGFLTRILENDSLRISDIGAVWLRKSADFHFRTDGLGAQEKAFAIAEMEHILFGLLFGLDCYWMSHPLAVRSALWKGEQLQRAARYGFQVPVSIVTNRPESVRKFSSAIDGDMIFKALSTPLLAADEVEAKDRIVNGIGTTRLGRDDLVFLDAVEELPSFFQKYVPKEYELRVTVIGDDVFAAEIHSQDDERTRTDYRDFSAEIPYEKAQLPTPFARRCREFVQSYGLNFGAMDFIVTPDGDYVFLENNPAGQFLFVEELVPELRMMDAVTECLLRGAGV